MKENPIIPVIKFQLTDLSFEIQTLQSMRLNENACFDVAHSHDYFEIIWLAQGVENFWLDLKKYQVNDSAIFCIKPGQVHRLELAADAQGYVLSFTDSFLNIGEHEFDWTCQNSLFRIFSGTANISVDKEMAKDLEEVTARMIKEYGNADSFRAQLLKRYLKIFLIYLTRQFEQSIQHEQQTRNSEIVENFMSLLERNFKQKRMVAQYAGQLSVTPNYLNDIIKRNTGYSAGYHIRQRVALEAKRMGVYSNVCMKEVAYSLGFNDCAHFSKFFKTVTGSNFTDFKREIRTAPLNYGNGAGMLVQG